MKPFAEHKYSTINAFEEDYSLIHFSNVNVLREQGACLVLKEEEKS